METQTRLERDAQHVLHESSFQSSHRKGRMGSGGIFTRRQSISVRRETEFHSTMLGKYIMELPSYQKKRHLETTNYAGKASCHSRKRKENALSRVEISARPWAPAINRN